MAICATNVVFILGMTEEENCTFATTVEDWCWCKIANTMARKMMITIPITSPLIQRKKLNN